MDRAEGNCRCVGGRELTIETASVPLRVYMCMLRELGK